MKSGRLGWRGVAYLALLLAIAFVVVKWWGVLAPIWRDQMLTFVGAVLLIILAQVIQAKNFVSFLGELSGIRVWTLSRVWAITALLNYLGPLQPGVAARVAYLARCGVKVSDSLLATWRQICVSVWISLGGLALGLMLTGDSRAKLPSIVLAVSFVALVLLRKALKGFLRYVEKPAWIARHKSLINSAIEGISPAGVAGVTLQYVIGTLLLLWVYHRFGATISLGQAIVLACMVYVSSLIAIMPGNLGVMDGIYMIGGHGMGLSATESAALALLLRASHIGGCLLMSLAGRASVGGRRPNGTMRTDG